MKGLWDLRITGLRGSGVMTFLFILKFLFLGCKFCILDSAVKGSRNYGFTEIRAPGIMKFYLL